MQPALGQDTFEELGAAQWLDRGRWSGSRVLHTRPVLGGLENPLPRQEWSEEFNPISQVGKTGPGREGPLSHGVLWEPSQAANQIVGHSLSREAGRPQTQVRFGLQSWLGSSKRGRG